MKYIDARFPKGYKSERGGRFMKQIPIAELAPGMVTAEDILIHNQKTLIPKGVVLTENIISRLEGYSIYYANIEDDLQNRFFFRDYLPP